MTIIFEKTLYIALRLRRSYWNDNRPGQTNAGTAHTVLLMLRVACVPRGGAAGEGPGGEHYTASRKFRVGRGRELNASNGTAARKSYRSSPGGIINLRKKKNKKSDGLL